MATILLSAAGAAVGAGFGGTVLGLSGAVIGRAVGATLGRVIDQKLLGAGSQAIEVGRIERFRLMGASDGAMIPLVWGRTRIAGQVIWATQFRETATTTGGGKGAPKPTTRQFSYTVSLAVALCEGEITRVGRIWADGLEIEKDQLNLRVYRGTETQVSDPKIAAVEGQHNAPAYRGTAYVVIEDLDLSRFGNRLPQFNFEVMRRANSSTTNLPDLPGSIRGVALIPGTGEYALATTRVHYAEKPGVYRSANVNSASGKTDFSTSLEQLNEELPDCDAVSLVVSWFGNDLRCGSCLVQPKVEQKRLDGVGMPWRAGGIGRSAAAEVPALNGRAVYGGTPSDASVIEAIRAATQSGKKVMFYPFILMDQLAGNMLPDPWTGEAGQPVLPWRGRITTSIAAGLPGTPDRSFVAAAEVAAFMGTAQPSHFAVSNGAIVYSGPDTWRYRRFILHYAKLCALAGGVEAFCIGSEMVSATRIRGANNSFPMVDALRLLASEVRAILGPSVKISYAADWSEYFGYHIGGNVHFHLDPLWSDANIDFIGIDNYMPVSDWRDGGDHADAHWGTIYNIAYLKANIAGGEGFDWYYDSAEGRAAQRRLPIDDQAYDEAWVFRNKDIASWWRNHHHDRIDGVRQNLPTTWIPQSKPVRFTEYGCGAVDKATNQPNVFIDPKSSESALARFSNGRRDDFIQHQYFVAFAEYWTDPAHNPSSTGYAGAMVDIQKSYAWAWDTRPYPVFPANENLWNDAGNYYRGHWLNGRVTSQPLANVVHDICERAGVADAQTSDLSRVVRGYSVDDIASARAALQPLSLVFAFDAVDREGSLSFQHRGARAVADLTDADLAIDDERFGKPEFTRAGEPDLAGQVQIGFVDDRDAYQVRYADAIFPNESARVVSQSETGIVMNSAEARATAERWLVESRVARDTTQLDLPLSSGRLGAGDVFTYGAASFRIDRAERRETLRIDAVRVEADHHAVGDAVDQQQLERPFTPPLPVFAAFLDIPNLQESNIPHAPYVAAFAQPWQGDVGVWRSVDNETFVLDTTIPSPAMIATTLSDLRRAQAGVWDDGDALIVELSGNGTLQSVSETALFAGANSLAIGDGSAGFREILQFRDAELIAPNTFALRRRLRGQLGSDGTMPDVWPTGSQIIVLDLSLRQSGLADSQRGLEQHFRIGSLARGPEDASALILATSFDGNGLRPYPVAHLRADKQTSGPTRFSWIRRTRRGGDSWQSLEVPLAEDSEQYALEIFKDGSLLRRIVVTSATWDHTPAMQAADAVSAPYSVRVSQISQAYGPGPFREVVVSV
jgi:GTA TIM-barrel-like domain/Putative phage tail protein